MDSLPEIIDQLVTKHMRRILILLFTMLIGMAIAMNAPAHAQTRAPATTTRGAPTAPLASPARATAPVPLLVGVVSDATDASITITPDATTGGNTQPKTFRVGTATRIEAPGITTIRTRPTGKNIAIGDTVAIVSPDQAAATVITIAAKGALPVSRAKVFLGTVSSREATSSGTILSLKHPKNGTFAKALVTTTTLIAARGLDKATVDDIKASDRVVVSGIEDARSVIQARRVFLIPGKARGLLDRVASPSASPKKASPVAAKSASPRATATTRP